MIRFPRGWEEQFQRDPEVRRVLAAKAEEAKTLAEVHARGFAKSGDYAESFVVDGVSLGNIDPFAHGIEWGSVNNRPYAPLRKAVEATGAKWVDTGG